MDWHQSICPLFHVFRPLFMVKVQTKEFIFHYKTVDFTFLRNIKPGDLGFNQVNFVVHLILSHLVEAVCSLLDIPAHFYGNRGKLIKIFGKFFPWTNSYLPLLIPGFKTRPSTDFTPQVTSWTEEVDCFFFIANLTCCVAYLESTRNTLIEQKL